MSSATSSPITPQDGWIARDARARASAHAFARLLEYPQSPDERTSTQRAVGARGSRRLPDARNIGNGSGESPSSITHSSRSRSIPFRRCAPTRSPGCSIEPAFRAARGRRRTRPRHEASPNTSVEEPPCAPPPPSATRPPPRNFSRRPNFLSRSAIAPRYSWVWDPLNANEHRRPATPRPQPAAPAAPDP
jgi:hypothetical protein